MEDLFQPLLQQVIEQCMEKHGKELYNTVQQVFAEEQENQEDLTTLSSISFEDVTSVDNTAATREGFFAKIYSSIVTQISNLLHWFSTSKDQPECNLEHNKKQYQQFQQHQQQQTTGRVIRFALGVLVAWGIYSVLKTRVPSVETLLSHLGNLLYWK